MRLKALLLASALTLALPLAAQACSNPLVVKDGNAASQNLAITCDANSNAESNAVVSLHTQMGVAGSITRPANTTAYAVNEIICNGTCAAGSTAVARGNGLSGSIDRVLLYKSTSGSGGPFELDLYDASPSVNSLSDQGAWTGPVSTDVTGGKWIGRAKCDSPISTVDAGLVYDCTLSANVLNFIAGSGSENIYWIASTLGSYTPGSAEVFTVVFGSLND